MTRVTTDGGAQPRAAFGVDVEDWYHAENVQCVTPRSLWSQCESRVEGNVARILELLESSRVRATFFVLGCVAERFPQTIVRRIAAAGHELASHGCDHDLLSKLSPADLREDFRRSKRLLEDIAGVPVIGYRATSFSIRDEALDLFAEKGYVYDSSYNPVIASSRYGGLDTDRIEKASAIL